MIIHLHDKRKLLAELPSKIQHVLAGVPLLLTGLHKLRENTELPVAFVEITIAALVLATFIKELRAGVGSFRHGSADHSAVGWFDIAAGVLLIFEAFHGAHGKPGYLRPQFLSGVVTIGIGLFHSKLPRRRQLRLDEIGLEFRRGLFRRTAIRWKDLDWIDLSGPFAVFYRRDGRTQKVRLKFLHNHKAVVHAIAQHASAAGVRSEYGAMETPVAQAASAASVDNAGSLSALPSSAEEGWLRHQENGPVP